MTSLALLLAPLFPWDRANESALGHHHLIAAYCFAWGLQIAYLAYVGIKWRSLAKLERQTNRATSRATGSAAPLHAAGNQRQRTGL